MNVLTFMAAMSSEPKAVIKLTNASFSNAENIFFITKLA